MKINLQFRDINLVETTLNFDSQEILESDLIFFENLTLSSAKGKVYHFHFRKDPAVFNANCFL